MIVVSQRYPCPGLHVSTAHPQIEATSGILDVLIVGAGLSGIGAAHRLQRDCPTKRYAILEARTSIGGTWDLFRYPGVRSDSDMYTLGYDFKPWADGKAIAGGAAIQSYIRETADAGGITAHIRFGHVVRSVEWSTSDAYWTVGSEELYTALILLANAEQLAEGRGNLILNSPDGKELAAHPLFTECRLTTYGRTLVEAMRKTTS